ncbi:coenzyme A transferase [Vibrio sp. N418]|nr:coenzyme A transferase [Vibrio sp. N418]
MTAQGLELIEIAPNLDFQRDIMQQMSFKPLISSDLKVMDLRLFDEQFELSSLC